ncbi:[FeFe] hydrogenase H-cluster radical SAM maturase HydG [Roseimarinus sediminis]|jgi:2-iminoacetate synthase|uniref:[FeFe] hydrogenase H-cluster radical SAM maturase HydG n=1 Tax=Roseimarinus sediminis TaxID=1610899 RepID=UPI003D1F1F59
MQTKEWIKQAIKPEENLAYLDNGNDFIDEEALHKVLESSKAPSDAEVRAIIAKAKSIEALSLEETAKLMHVTSSDLWNEINEAALEIKRKVYDNRIVFFAPLYCSNLCVNNCAYCGFRTENKGEVRRILTRDEIIKETESVLDTGHKRLIMVYGEHPQSDINYMVETIKAVYSVERKAPVSGRSTSIRRVNINAAPMSIADLKRLREAGIGTYQVFQETYHKATYEAVHPPKTLKGNYQWRLYALHRAQEAGIDDVAIGALFGLYDWRFEVLGLVAHAAELEKQFGVGPHTVSVPRLTPASGSLLSTSSKYLVNDDDFKKLVAVLRLALPYPGLIITAREQPEIKREIIKLGCTQTDASTRIGIGAYQECNPAEDRNTEQFTIGDGRSLDSIIKEVGEMGMISSFCTAGYRCGRTGDTIMGMLKHCVEGKFCKLNAVLTYREYLDDYASPETKAIGEKLIEQEIGEIKNQDFFMKNNGKIFNDFMRNYELIKSGKRDIYI